MTECIDLILNIHSSHCLRGSLKVAHPYISESCVISVALQYGSFTRGENQHGYIGHLGVKQQPCIKVCSSYLVMFTACTCTSIISYLCEINLTLHILY